MTKRVAFRNRLLPWLLVAPQLAVTAIFFFWPTAEMLWQSLLVEDAFGGSVRFVWFRNFARLFADPGYWNSVQVTIVFSTAVTLTSLAAALLLAVMADRAVRAGGVYKTFLIWPYAVAPAVAGVLWGFMFSPRVGLLAYYLNAVGIEWNHILNPNQAFALVVAAASWTQISYNFVFFLAGLQSIPKSLIEAAAIDGAGPGRRFWTIIFPLLSPTGFFLLVVNLIHAFFETFGVVDALTKGGPAKATEILVFKVYNDGFRGQDFGGSAAQSSILMLVVIALTIVQFRFIERRVHY
jgi:sn-glycerol 3-phosphate transport system permease protein